MHTVSEWISTGHLPSAEVVEALVLEAHQRYAPVVDGKVADYIPALAAADAEQFGICVAGCGGQLIEAGDSRASFSIQSISKPFQFALICQGTSDQSGESQVSLSHSCR